MKIKSLTIIAAACVALSSCSDEFLKDMKNYDQATDEVYNYYSGALGRLADAYTLALPYNGSSVPVWQAPGDGSADDTSKATEEYSGFSCYVNPEVELSSTSNTNGVPDYFMGEARKVRNSTWGRIRNINDLIAGITAGDLPADQKNELLGQAHFLRGWCYWLMFQWYGGVPLIDEVLEPEPGDSQPRATTRETLDFIIADLDTAADLLEASTGNGGWSSDNYGRASTAAALALKGRALVLYASPLFNRQNDKQRWTDAYNFFVEAIPRINRCGNYLAYEGNPGVNASNWAKMFNDENNPEAIFGVNYNEVPKGGLTDYCKNNRWEQGIRPSNTLGGGGKTPSAQMVDLFPMKDGKRPSSYNSYTVLNPSSIVYNPNLPFVDRDPRFYRTFAFPGVDWAFNGDPRTSTNHIPYNGPDYQLWNYVWYASADDRANVESGKTYGPDGLLGGVKGMYVRKRTDDLHVNAAYRYAYTQGLGFETSADPYIEIRYADVLLNYAEAACQSGHNDVALEQLKKIRERVGYTGDCGFDGKVGSEEAATMAAILYERQIELAYEGKRFYDLRRWMLFDGGEAKVPGAPSTWTLTGWGGNTCNYLGFEPLNGQRRENMEFRVQDKYNGGLGGDKFGSNGENPDPLADVARPAALDYRNTLEPQVQALSEFYTTYLERATKKGDGYNSAHAALYMNFRPQYYFPGIGYSAMINTPSLEQTIGWSNAAKAGTAGTFDPLK